jgi:GLPGLI family protein
MQKIFLIITVLVFGQTMDAQMTQGTIIYERTVNMHRRMTDESQKAMIPEFNTSKVQLLFAGSESIFKNLPEEKDVRDDAGDDGNRVMIKMGGAENETYKNYLTGKSVELRELGPRKYIIEDSLKKLDWRVEEGSKTINSYECKKATTKSREGTVVIAWFTEAIQSPCGPEQYGGLPGAILELDINDAEIVFTAQEVSTKAFNPKLVAAPSNGKRISSKEFQKMLDDEFGPNPNGGPVIRIIRN